MSMSIDTSDASYTNDSNNNKHAYAGTDNCFAHLRVLSNEQDIYGMLHVDAKRESTTCMLVTYLVTTGDR